MATPDYINPPIENDPNALYSQALDSITTAIPGWSPNALDDAIIMAFAVIAAEQADVLSAALTSVFRYFGSLVQVFPIDAVAATAQATFTMVDNTGYTVGQGSVVGVRDVNGDLQGFDLLADLVVPNGQTTGTATVQAETQGAIGNSLSGACQLVQTPGSVSSATLAASSGGSDAEDDATYLGRLVETLALLSPEPILAPDFGVMARTVAGVYRACAVDELKPGPPYDVAAEATGQEKCVTVAVTDTAGADPGGTIRGNVQTFLRGLREQNFLAFAVAATYAEIDVVANITAWPGWDTTDVQTRVNAALTTALSPSQWGTDSTGNPTHWLNSSVLRLTDLAKTIMNVQGVRNITSLTFGLHGGALAGTNLDMSPTSAVPVLPTPGTFTLTVVSS